MSPLPLALTVGLAIASLLPVLGRWHWFPDLFSHFVPHYAALALILAITLLWARRFALTGVALVLLGLHLAQLSHYWGWGTALGQSSGKTEPIRVVQFNTAHQSANQREVMGWLEGKLDSLDIIVLPRRFQGFPARHDEIEGP